MERTFKITINKPVEDVFARLADLERNDEWMPSSDMYDHTELESEPPVKKGSKFVNIPSNGVKMPGVVHIYDPPHRIGFNMVMPFVLWFKCSSVIEYTLKPDGDRTHVERHAIFTMPLLLKPLELLIKNKLIAENTRVLECLKTAVENAGGG